MKNSVIFLKRQLSYTLACIMMVPCAILLTPTESSAGGIAVRGPRGGGAAVGTGRHYNYHRGPASVHGTARRTSRRTARRTTRRLTALPRGYTTRVVGGVNYYYYSGRYYEPVYQGNTVVYIEVVFD